jgi:molybdate transport system ATP-binding protein
MSIEVNVAARRGAFALEVRFSIEKSGVTALFGPSGAGKTSVVNAIAGLVRPGAGRIVINGRTVFDRAAGVDLPARERRVGYVFQDARLFPHMDVERNLLFGWRRAAVKAGAEEIARVENMLGIAHLRRRSTGTLSGGEKQRVAIGRALLSSPEILLLDEPMASIDAARREEILPYLERLRDARRIPVLVVSHAVDEVARLADEVVVLQDGKVTAQGSVFDLMPQIDPKAGVVLPVRIARHRSDGLTELDFGGGHLVVRRLQAEPGTQLRVRIAANDVMLSLNALTGISANNMIAAFVSALRPAGSGLVDVLLMAGSATLVARVTEASVSRLGLKEGTALFAVVKAVTVDAAIGAE